MALTTLDQDYIEQRRLRIETRAAIAGKYEVLKIITSLPGPQYRLFQTFPDMSIGQRERALQTNAQNC